MDIKEIGWCDVNWLICLWIRKNSVGFRETVSCKNLSGNLE
jgi:elongation factor P hydroxylase